MKLFIMYLSLGIMSLVATASMAGTDDALIKAERQVVKSKKIVKDSRDAVEDSQRFLIVKDKEISTSQSQLDAAKRTEEDQATQHATTYAALKSSPGDSALRQALSNRSDELDAARRSTRAMKNALKDAKIERDRAASNSSRAQAALEAAIEAQARSQNQLADAKIAKLKVWLGNSVETKGSAEEGPCLTEPIQTCERRLRAQAIEHALNIGREAIVRSIQKEFGLSPDEIMQVATITVSGEPNAIELDAGKRGGRARVNAVIAGQLTSSGESSLRSRWGSSVNSSNPIQIPVRPLKLPSAIHGAKVECKEVDIFGCVLKIDGKNVGFEKKEIHGVHGIMDIAGVGAFLVLDEGDCGNVRDGFFTSFIFLGLNGKATPIPFGECTYFSDDKVFSYRDGVLTADTWPENGRNATLTISKQKAYVALGNLNEFVESVCKDLYKEMMRSCHPKSYDCFSSNATRGTLRAYSDSVGLNIEIFDAIAEKAVMGQPPSYNQFKYAICKNSK